ncbi:hypothetical protein J437_LFUL018346 [Ladona fulva]|uniref:Peptidase S1 domain-containing protein n=1 Tax=Ladona fulva TaxID=123851 RepID=A0A8K0KQ46_LADFU|nr:hypothetical protein J437_LFUL018346 [Ladona fulva]
MTEISMMTSLIFNEKLIFLYRKQAEYLTVRAGEWDTQTRNELYGHKDSPVSSIVMHENYYAGALYNDVALLFLSQPIEQAENIGFICLPEQGQLPNPSTRCFASGWGKDVYGKAGKYQVILKKVELPVVARDQCLQALRTTRLGSRFKLHSSFMCAGGEKGKDTCKGDGGSPLVCPVPGKPGRYYQSGMVAWGIGCGENKIPGVYANVALFRNWIDRQMEYNNLDKKKQAEYLTVRAGEWDTQTRNELYGHKDSPVSSIVMHENYYAGALYNDVALLFLSQPIEQAENIGFICLPEQGQLPNPSTRCFASGWGKDVYGKAGKYQVILKKVELPVVARDQCLQALRTTRLGSRFKLHSSFMCAGGEKGKDTCKVGPQYIYIIYNYRFLLHCKS